jgi:hypothetical protein
MRIDVTYQIKDISIFPLSIERKDYCQFQKKKNGKSDMRNSIFLEIKITIIHTKPQSSIKKFERKKGELLKNIILNKIEFLFYLFLLFIWNPF